LRGLLVPAWLEALPNITIRNMKSFYKMNYESKKIKHFIFLHLPEGIHEGIQQGNYTPHSRR
jgi:hypothetical protein